MPLIVVVGCGFPVQAQEQRLPQLVAQVRGTIRGVDVAPDGRVLLWNDFALWTLALRTFRLNRVLNRHLDYAQFVKQGREIAVVTRDRYQNPIDDVARIVTTFRASAGGRLQRINIGQQKMLPDDGFRFSPDGRMLSLLRGQIIIQVPLASPKNAKQVILKGDIYDANFGSGFLSPDASRIALLGNTRLPGSVSLFIYDVGKKQEVQRLIGQFANFPQFSPDNSLLCADDTSSVSEQGIKAAPVGSLRVFDIQTGFLLWQAQEKMVTFSPDSKLVLTTTSNMILLRKSRSGIEVARYSCSSPLTKFGYSASGSFSLGGDCAFVGDYEGRLWKLETR